MQIILYPPATDLPENVYNFTHDIPDLQLALDYQHNRIYFCPISGKIWLRWILAPDLPYQSYSVSYEKIFLTRLAFRKICISKLDLYLLPKELLLFEFFNLGNI